MQIISDLLDENCVIMDIKAKRKAHVIRELISTLESAEKIENSEYYVNEVLEREKLSSTGIGQGIALPHKLLPNIDQIHIVFGRKKKGVSFGAIDNKPVYLFFLILGPEGMHSEHLKLLSKLSRLLHDQTLIDSLMDATTPTEVINVIKLKESS
ncbi:PTS sugar transporter subunit IIA [Chitinispirillales bacterium ANBcel5]|uniref:PTS sugar transporter subunit IIA n=1 Tax=Cellulosispirillum alkaliphilum TaxID=3039283 RepID=UPI002A572255|nr:PTS sugar transporter subunit IIA [Chitinispirillales bacterium ANBcel5]